MKISRSMILSGILVIAAAATASAQTATQLSPGLRARTRDQDSHTVKGKQHDVGIFELIWQESEGELTALSTRPNIRPGRLKLTHGEREIALGETAAAVTIGRDAQNDVIIMDRKASRMHARIERRREKFVLIDHSSNGSYVTVEGQDEVALRREEMTLRGRGRVSFGHSYKDDPTEYLVFSFGE